MYNPRESIREFIDILREKGFSLEEVGDTLYIRASQRDAVLADLPRRFLEEVVRAGFKEVVLVIDGRYYYYRRDDVERLLRRLVSK